MPMSVTLKAIKATLNPDGSFQMDTPFPFEIPTEVIVTIAIEEKIPNAVTRAAMDEPKEGLQGYTDIDELMLALKS